MKEPTFVCSIDVRKLCELMADTHTGQTLTYKEMSEAIGRDVQTEARSILISARKITQRELGFVFGTIHGEGLKRLSDIEIVQTGAETVVKIRHASRRGADRIAHAAPEKLPIESRTQMNTYLSLLAMVHAATQDKRIKKLEEKVAQVEARLPLEQTLDVFKS